LLYWITERNQIRLRKEVLSLPKPWSEDVTFQNTYFCNVRREHDTVTKFIRNYYSPFVEDSWYLYNIIFSRFINWPKTLETIGYMRAHDPVALVGRLYDLAASNGKIWGGAYVITTHGIPMPKAAYLARNVLGATYNARELLNLGTGYQGTPSCAAAHTALQSIEGLGSFLAAQVVADLKNTVGHPLNFAKDRDTFVAHGPGSMRGLQWFWQAEGVTITPRNFYSYFDAMRLYVDENWNETLMGKPICNQDLQNCLCEFDKYCRVSSGTGRSKRNYPGTS
jgi:5-hmdU DNA kinase, helical domain